MTDAVARRHRFRSMHEATELFIIPNPWDVGSAVLLEHAGAPAVATTSSGLAWSIGKADQRVTRTELIEHVRAVVDAVDVPVHVDSERCFADDPGGVAATIASIADAGAAGCSIEDYDPATGAIDPLPMSVERVAAAASACAAAPGGMLLTARCEHHLYGIDDLEATIDRLIAYRDAGAECVYAPGLTAIDDIRRVCEATEIPVNVLVRGSGPHLDELAAVGVRRVSTGGALASIAYASALAEFAHLSREGRSDRTAARLTTEAVAVFDGP